MVDNNQIAEIFENIAQLLTIKGEMVYRVMAYQRAAESIRSLSQEVEELWKENRLTDIPRVGKAIADKIAELLGTGRLELYERLTAEVPPSLLAVLGIGDVGPKKAALFWRELGITTVEGVEAAAREKKLRQLPGMGARSEERILENIEAMRRRQTGRIPIGTALPLTELYLGRLREVEGVDAAEPGGSLRRWRETVGDIDLVAAATDSSQVIEAFCRFPEVARVLGQGETKLSVELKQGVRVQLWVHPPDRFGSALQYATGSQAHNVRLREYARAQGMSLSEHGFVQADGSQILCAAEEQVYEVLGLPWIPPELREDRGEVRAAIERQLPDLVRLQDVVGDLQAHSDWSDGSSTILEMGKAAASAGLSYLAITDHSRSLGIARGLSMERLREQRKAIDSAQRELGDSVRLLQGTEVEILADGQLDYPDEVLSEVDVVVASLHTSLRQPRERATERLLAAIRNPHVDVIGHPSGRLIGSRDPADLDMEAVISEAAKQGVILEINAHPDRLDLNDVHTRRAVALGCMLAINTDAHGPDGFADMKYGVGVARRGWATAASVVNTWPVEKVLEKLEARGG